MQYDIIYIVDYRIHPNIWGGMDSFFEDISKELYSRNLEHIFLFSSNYNTDNSHYIAKNIPSVMLHGNNLMSSAIKFCSENRSKIIHTHFISSFTNKYRILSRYTNFIITTEHMSRPISGWTYGKKIKSKINYYLSKKYITKLIHVSKYIEVENRCSFGDFEDKSIVIYNGVKINELEREYSLGNFNENPIKLISVGRLVEEKGFDKLIRITKNLIESNFNVELNILGDGYLRDELETQAGEYLNKFIFLQGKVNNVNQWLRKSDIYVHAASQEAFAFVFLEAGEAGLPIITLDVGGNREFIIDRFNGFLLNKLEDDEVFTSKIKYYYNNPKLIRLHGVNCRKLVEMSFSNDIMIENYINQYAILFNKL